MPSQGRIRPLPRPPGTPDRGAQRVIDAMAAYVREERRDPLKRVAGIRHIVASAHELADEAVELAHNHPRHPSWEAIGGAMGVSASTASDAAVRHRRAGAQHLGETG